MKAVILAAGLGTRLLPLTEEKPKILFPILNRLIGDIIIDNLKEIGICKIGMNLHYKSNMIKDYFKKGENHGVPIYYSYEEEVLETGGGLANFINFIGDEDIFIVHNCDILTNINLKEAINFHKDWNPMVTMVLIDNPLHNTVLIDKFNRVKSIGYKIDVKKDKGDKVLCGAGIFIYNSNIFNYLPRRNRPYSVIPIIKKMLKTNPGSVMAYTPNKEIYWKDIGNTTVKYFEVHRDIFMGKTPNFPGVCQPQNGTWIHPESQIDKNVNFKGFVSIGKGVKVKKGSQLFDCILWDNSEIIENSEYISIIKTQANTIYI